MVERERRVRESSNAFKQQEAYRRLLGTRDGMNNNVSRGGGVEEGGRAGSGVRGGSAGAGENNGGPPRSRTTNGVVKDPSHPHAQASLPSSFSISISQNKLRRIADPMTQVLGLMHKLMFVSTLPAHRGPVGVVAAADSRAPGDVPGSTSEHVRRRLVDTYVTRHLFSAQYRGGSRCVTSLLLCHETPSPHMRTSSTGRGTLRRIPCVDVV